MSKAYPAWAGWLFLLLGPCYTVPLYYHYFRPGQNAGNWRLFAPPEDPGLWLAAAIVTICFSGVGVSCLANRRRWKHTHWNTERQIVFPQEPWRWRADWDQRHIEAETSHGQCYVLLWAALCFAAALPNLEFWHQRGGGWPDHRLSVAGLVAVTIGVLAAALALRSLIQKYRQPSAVLHLASKTAIIGGSLEGGVELSDATIDTVVARLVCEQHWIEHHSDGEGTSAQHNVRTEYEDTLQSTKRNGFFPIRFGIPFSKVETSRESMTPVRLWYLELLNAEGRQLCRFQVPVFKTEDSREDFELTAAAADTSIAEEDPTAVLARYGILVSEIAATSDSMRSIVIPPMRAPQLAFGLLLFGLFTSTVSLCMMLFLDELFRYLFVVVFGCIGLLLTSCAMPMLLERRTVSFDSRVIQVRRSYFGWTRTLSRDDTRSLAIQFSGSSGGRVKYKNLVATTDGMTRKDGSMMDRRFSIISTVPAEAAEAAKAILECAATG